MEPEDQTLAPKTREEEVTDTAMADTNENPEATQPNSPDSSESNDSDSEDEDEAQQKFELQNIESQLANEPSNYDVHVQYIRVLRKMGEIEKLSQAREAMNEIFPLTPVMWQEWARDEASISTGPEAFLGIEKIYERGVFDYLSVSLWCDYLRFVQEYDPSVREFSPDGIAKARNLFERAITAAGLHVAEGSKIWEAYREFVQAILHTIDETNIKEKEKQVQRIRSIFHRQLSVPLANLRSTLLAYKSWEVEMGTALDVESGDLDGIPSTVASAYQKALEMYNARADFEEQIARQDISDSEKFQQFAIYLKFEQSSGDLARVQLLYERAITEFPVSSDLWLDYTRYLDKTFKVGNIVRDVHSRARKNCPWVGDLWVRSLLALERCHAPEKEISTVFEKSLLCTFSTIEEYLNLFLTRVDGLRRRILLPGAEEDALNFSLIRETFQRASDYLSQQMKNTDGLLHLYAYWARLELNLGKDQAAARGVWESLVKICGSMLEAWQGYIAMEIELGHLNEARSIYRRCYCKRFSGTGSEDICHNWLRFEREYGTLEDFDHAAQKVTPRLEELQLFRLQQEAKSAPKLIDQKEKSYKKSDHGKRKTDSNITDEESPAKRQKNTAQNPKKVHGKEKGRAQNLTKENEVKEAKPKFEEHPNDQHIKDSTTGRAKVYTDECTAFVKHLNLRATSEDLKKFFSDVGGVESVRILQDKFTGKSRGLAYVDFADDAHLAAAIGKDNQMFLGKRISIARSNPKQKRKDSADHGASGEHATLLILCTLANAMQHPGLILTLVNNCPFTVWPAIQPNAGHPVLERGGFPLQSLTHRSFPGPAQHWSGRIWARTGCTHSNGYFSCVTGDCGHRLECNGLGGATPSTLAQFSLHHGQKDFSSYGVSLVDGFNVPLTVTPHEGTGVCPVVGCRANLLATCPDRLQVRSPPGHGSVVGCKSGCEAFGTDELCCRNHYNSPQTCRASSFSEFFKHACPSTFTYAHDSPSLMHECSSPRELKVIFCH